jgi:hypothetical protein
MSETSTLTTSALPRPTDRSRLLALIGPLLLFVHGILGWVDGLDGTRGTGWVWGLGGLALVAAVGSLTLLTAELGEQTGRGPLAAVAVVIGAFGAGVVAAVTLGRLLGVLGDDLPTTLTAGGPVLVAAGLALLGFRLVLAGRMPIGSALLAILGAAMVAVPWDLLPLGALILLIGFGPLTQRRAEATARAEASSAAYPWGVPVQTLDAARTRVAARR